jgi:hypothetical protein
MPAWFCQRFSARYTARNPFAATIPTNFGLQSLPEDPGGVLVSTLLALNFLGDGLRDAWDVRGQT